MRRKTLSEGKVVALIAAVHFVNVLDFMMVMPLGPDFAQGLGISTANLGFVGGSYTAAAGVAGLIGSLFLDRFDRRKGLFVAMVGLALATILGGFAVNLESLILARVLAGIFGGPATSISLSIIADVVPPARRGRAIGTVMGAFSVASVFGVPAGLELARLGGWRLPFFGIGGLCLLVTFCVIAILPAMRAHLGKERIAEFKQARAQATGVRTEVFASHAMNGMAMLGAFFIIPNFSAFFLHNLAFPREKLGLMYLVGGTVSFIAMRVAGRVIDRFNALAVGIAATILLLGVLYGGFCVVPPYIPAALIFTGFMMGMSVRGVVLNSLSSRVPKPYERAGFMSVQSAVQHFSAAAGALFSTRLLHAGSGGPLVGMTSIASIAISISVGIPLLVYFVETRVRRGEIINAEPKAETAG